MDRERERERETDIFLATRPPCIQCSAVKTAQQKKWAFSWVLKLYRQSDDRLVAGSLFHDALRALKFKEELGCNVYHRIDSVGVQFLYVQHYDQCPNRARRLKAGGIWPPTQRCLSTPLPPPRGLKTPLCDTVVVGRIRRLLYTTLWRPLLFVIIILFFSILLVYRFQGLKVKKS